MLVSKETIIGHINAVKGLPEDVRDSYLSTFSGGPNSMDRQTVEALSEKALENLDPDAAAFFYIPVEELINGKEPAPISPIEISKIERVVTEKLPEHNSVRHAFLSALRNISDGGTMADPAQIQRAFDIASDNPFPQSQQDSRDAYHDDVQTLRSALGSLSL
ncbi:MAG TPA: hypothetical protein DEA55_02830 [Rhodospirillaceae bacterium]|nr:hypothetical protein [Rhodospirillaceae bacterium]